MWRLTIACALVTGCGFHRDGGTTTGDPDASPMFDDAGREIVNLTFDAAADFTRPGSTLVDMSVEPWGSLSPGGYVYGVALGRATNSARFDAATADGALAWEPTAVVGTGGWDADELAPPVPIEQFGLTGGAFTIWIEGEVELPMGMTQFHLIGDDIAFLDVAKPHATDYTRVVVSRNGNETTRSFMAMKAGWYPFRIGFASPGTAFRLALEHTPPGGGRQALRRSTMRGRGDAGRGFLRGVWDHQLLGDAHPIFALPASDGINETFPTPPPGAGAANTRWSARYTGQFYAASQGTYTFQVSSDDGHRVISGATVAEASWEVEQAAAPSVSLPIAMARGWNDLVVDYNQVDGDRNLALAVTVSPSGDSLIGPIPAPRLRPVEPRAERLASGGDTRNQPIPDNDPTGVTAAALVHASAGEAILAIDVVAVITSPKHQDLAISVGAPNSQVLQLANHDLATGGGRRTYHFPITATGLLGSPPEGTWSLAVKDDVNGGGSGSVLEAFYVALRLHDGPDQIARAASWTSEIVDNPSGIALFDGVSWTGRDTSAPAVVELRTCDAPCTTEPWTKVASGEAPAVATRRYLQARVQLASDGIASPELEQLAIMYRRNPVVP